MLPPVERLTFSAKQQDALDAAFGPGKIFRPEQFGAAGQGNATADTAAWVALAAATQDGYTIHATGEYLIAGSTVIFSALSKITLDLSGAIFRQQTAFSQTFTFTNCIDPTVIGGTFYGYAQKQIDALGSPTEYNGASSSWNGVSALFFSGSASSTVTVERGEFVNHAGGDISGRNISSKIRNCKSRGIGSAYINPIDNGSDFFADFFTVGSPGDAALDWLYTHEWTDNDVADHAFGFQVVQTKWVIFARNNVSCCGQHGLYGIELDNAMINDNRFVDCPQFGAKIQLENYAGVYVGPLWVTSHAYLVGDIVRRLSTLYVCLIAHTSGTFATDLAANKWEVSDLNYRKGGTVSGNVAINCLSLFGVIRAAPSLGSVEYIRDLKVFGNTARGCTQDGIFLQGCHDADVFDNIFDVAARYGISVTDFSGEVHHNTVLSSACSGLRGSAIDYKTGYNHNKLVDVGLTGTSTDAYPVYFVGYDVGNSIPAHDSVPVIVFGDNEIRFTTGDAASAQLTFFSADYDVAVYGTKTNSALDFRVEGALLDAFRNEFAAFYTAGQNLPYTVTNASTDRALNVTADTTAQVAAVLGTLIADLQTKHVI